MKTQSGPLTESNGEPREKQKGVESVTAVLMALAILSTTTGVFFVVVSRLFSIRFKLKTS